MKKIGLGLIFFLPWITAAQSSRLTGVVKDAATGTALPGATVTLTLLEDTTQTTSGPGKSDGAFAVENLKPQAYRLQVRFLGYSTFDTTLTLRRGENGPLNVRLREKAVELGEVKVEALRAPVELKGDTVQYNAEAYKTNRDADASELINKLPGVSVEGGTVKAHGEEVKRVTVDGKPFFGNDPNAALKNLPAGAVDKVQVFDRASDRARLTGADDGQAERTINFVLKPEYKNGLFGRIYAGYGTDERYNAGGSVNRFKEKRRLTLIGLFNNVNQRHFSSDDLSSLNTFSAGPSPGAGRGGRMSVPVSGLIVPSMGAGGGVNRTEAVGVNFTDEWKKIVVFSADYTFNHATRVAETLTQRTFFAGNLAYRETFVEKAVQPFHRYNLRAEINPDTSHALVVQSSGTFSFVRTDNQTTGINRVGGETTGSTALTVAYPHFVPNTRHNLTFRRKFILPRRLFSAELTAKTGDNTGVNDMIAANFSLQDTLAFRQRWTTNAPEYSIEANVSFAEPLGKISVVEATFEPQFHRRLSQRFTDRLAYPTGEFSSRDSSLSFVLPSDVAQNTGTVMIRFTPPKHYVHVGASVQYVVFTGGQTYPFDEFFRRAGLYPLMHLGWRADWSRTKKLRLFYRPSLRVPAAGRFQTALNNANPLSLSTGNVRLNPEYEHGIRGFFSLNQTEKGRTLTMYWFGNYVHDYIGSATYIARSDTFVSRNFLPRGGQFTRPENFSGYVLFRPSLSYGMTLSKIKNKLNFDFSPTYTRTPGIFNGTKNVVQRLSVGVGFSLSSAMNEKMDYTLSYNGGYTWVFNRLMPSRKQDFYNHTLTSRAYWNFWQGAFVQVNVSQTLFGGGGFDQSFWLATGAVGYKFFRNRSLTIQLEGFDLFDQNAGLSRTVNEAFIEDVRNLVVNRYFMLTAIWRFTHYPAERRIERYIGE